MSCIKYIDYYKTYAREVDRRLFVVYARTRNAITIIIPIIIVFIINNVIVFVV